MPHYKYSSLAGRLLPSQTHLQPLHPTSLLPVDKADPPKMIWDSIKTKTLKTAPLSAASFSTLDPKLLAKYKKFQANVEKPVFLMGGPPDKILFGATCAIVVVGVAQCFKLFYDMANPKK
ncbi:uncharacterized protein LOC106654213 [Trichogramma pretiosum]|uniref:uncharacterized protein LOC106654213 n=1 Tax=Trichogramma pretiosum TaxID=7493 RepID=UPI0006C98DD3|nr:uncharacterized protein LOC106654213 [Trichogramma pretiosum]